MGKRFDDFMENAWRNFDKILLALMFVVVLSVALWVTKDKNMDEGSLDWARSTANLLLGGLLSLVTDRLIRGKNTQTTESIQELPPPAAKPPVTPEAITPPKES